MGACADQLSLYMPDREPVIYELLADDAKAPLVAKEIYEHKEFHNLYDDLGVQAFDWKLVVERLEKLVRAQSTLTLEHVRLNHTRKAVSILSLSERAPRSVCGANILSCCGIGYRSGCAAMIRYGSPKIWNCHPIAATYQHGITLNTVIPIERRENLHPLV